MELAGATRAGRIQVLRRGFDVDLGDGSPQVGSRGNAPGRRSGNEVPQKLMIFYKRYFCFS